LPNPARGITILRARANDEGNSRFRGCNPAAHLLLRQRLARLNVVHPGRHSPAYQPPSPPAKALYCLLAYPPSGLIFSPDNQEQKIRSNGDESLMCGASGRFLSRLISREIIRLAVRSLPKPHVQACRASPNVLTYKRSMGHRSLSGAPGADKDSPFRLPQPPTFGAGQRLDRNGGSFGLRLRKPVRPTRRVCTTQAEHRHVLVGRTGHDEGPCVDRSCLRSRSSSQEPGPRQSLVP